MARNTACIITVCVATKKDLLFGEACRHKQVGNVIWRPEKASQFCFSDFMILVIVPFHDFLCYYDFNFVEICCVWILGVSGFWFCRNSSCTEYLNQWNVLPTFSFWCFPTEYKNIRYVLDDRIDNRIFFT